MLVQQWMVAAHHDHELFLQDQFYLDALSWGRHSYEAEVHPTILEDFELFGVFMS